MDYKEDENLVLNKKFLSKVIGVNVAWYKIHFLSWIEQIYELKDLELKQLTSDDLNHVDWNFLKFHKFKGKSVFAGGNLIQPEKISLEHKKLRDQIINQNIQRIFFDYYRRFIPFLCSFEKNLKSHMTGTIESKLPIIAMFFSSIGDISQKKIHSFVLDITEPQLKNILITEFETYCQNSLDFRPAVTSLSKCLKAINEYIKIISTLNIIDYRSVVFLEQVFICNYENYKSIYDIWMERCLLKDLSWVYTKAYILSK